MELLELVHIYEGSDTRFTIGYFSSQAAAFDAISQLIKKPGFCQYPDGFFVLPKSVQTQKSVLKKVYNSFIRFFPYEYHGGNYTEYDTSLGLYEEKDNAEKMIARYLELNPAGVPGLERICEVEVWFVDQIGAWSEGFTTG